MKVLLIQPPGCDPLVDRIFLFEPLALEYLGAGLKRDGHEVEVLDARLEPDIEGTCHRFQPDLVGLTGFTSHVNIIKSIAGLLKRIHSHNGYNYKSPHQTGTSLALTGPPSGREQFYYTGKITRKSKAMVIFFLQWRSYSDSV